MQVTDVLQEIGTMHGQRGIQFVFETTDGKRRVTFDFHGAGSNFNGATYAMCEAAALRSATTAGLTVQGWTHFLIS